MTGEAQLERSALCATLLQAGPDAPTLCEGWSTADLAAHLVLRERRPDALVGAFVPRFAGRTHRVQREYAGLPWPQLVDLVRGGPPLWSPLRHSQALDDVVNLVEFFVHHEDVLRAAPEWTPDRARPLGEALESGLWSRLRVMGQILFRRAGVGVVLVCPTRGRKTVRAETDRGSVVLSGTAGELTLYAVGRRSVAQVETFGSRAAVDHLAELALGF